MKTYKLKGLDMYVTNCASKKDAVFFCLMKRIGITVDNLVETDLKVDREQIGEILTEAELAPYLEN